MSDDLNWMNATKLAKLYRKGKASPVEVAEACLAQIARHDGSINAMCLVDEKAAIMQARASERRWKKGETWGPLDGVPALVKDLLLVKGWPTLRGSKTVERSQDWVNDAPSVARLREAGAVFLGMTTTPEFGWKGVTDSPLTGITRQADHPVAHRRRWRRVMARWRWAPMVAAAFAFRRASQAYLDLSQVLAGWRLGRFHPLAPWRMWGR
jgi:Asp-tRNA(Asn)/Glu-tRNA(Gln) amidotransferase A subunit family amidase